MPTPDVFSTATAPGPVSTAAVSAPPAPPGLADEPLSTVTWHDVELLATGQWNASTGQVGIDRAMLEQILAAAKDPDVDQAVVHPGHFDPRFPQQTDGEPILGTVRPTRIEDRGGRTVLLGDVAGIPPKLAAVLRQAYPRRSVELARGLRTPSGKVYSAALTGLGLLGVQTPAVKGLSDIVARYSALTVPDGGSLDTLTVSDTPSAPGGLPTASAPGLHDGPSPTPIESGAHKMPRTRTDAELREFLDLAADADVAALQASITTMGTPPATPPATAPVVTPPVVVPPVVVPPATAPATTPAPAEGDPAEKPTATPEAIAAAAATAATLSALTAGTQLPNGMVVIDPTVLATLSSAATDITTARRDRVVSDALTSGRLTPNEAFGADGKGGFRAQLDVDEASTSALISALSAGRVPVTERGTGRETASGVHLSAEGLNTEVWDAFETEMFGAAQLGRTTPPA